MGACVCKACEERCAGDDAGYEGDAQKSQYDAGKDEPAERLEGEGKSTPDELEEESDDAADEPEPEDRREQCNEHGRFLPIRLTNELYPRAASAI